MSNFKAHLYHTPAYQPPLEGRDPAQHLLLDFNERTLPVSQPVRQALINYINSDRLQMYPFYGDIVEQIADYAGVYSEQAMITNGSDQGIELVFRASCQPGDQVIIPLPNFAMYQQCAMVEKTEMITPYYTRDGGFPVDEVISALTSRTRVICIANPNNPSGVGVSREDIIRVAQAAPGTSILVDECYFEYSNLTVVDLIERYPNVIVTRTFSKTWGMPSLRFGYLLASPDNIRALLSIRGPYDINQLAVVAARAALQNPADTENYVNEVMRKSKPLFEDFLKEKQLTFWPSCANYIWVFVNKPENVQHKLAKDGILVRPKADGEGNIGLRITLGSLEQTKQLIETLKKVL